MRQAEYDSALTHYEAAIRWAPELYLAHYGLGQLYIHKGDTERAIASLEKVQAAAADDPDVLKILGTLYLSTNDASRRNKVRHASCGLCLCGLRCSRLVICIFVCSCALTWSLQAKEMLRHVCDVQPKDFAAWTELAQLLEATEPDKALQAYEKAAKVMENLRTKGEGQGPSVELYNNIGALRHLLCTHPPGCACSILHFVTTQ